MTEVRCAASAGERSVIGKNGMDTGASNDDDAAQTRTSRVDPLGNAVQAVSVPAVDPFEALSLPETRPALLVIEDDETTRAGVAELLASSALEVCACATGAEALALVRQRAFELALLDLYLPDMTGIDFLQRVRARGLELPVVVVSGSDSIDSAISAMRLGIVDYLRKPYDPRRLVETVHGALAAGRVAREHRALRARLEHSERLHRYLVEHSPDLIYMLDAGGCFRFVNDAFDELLGFPREQLLGRSYAEVVVEEDRGLADGVMNERRTGALAARNVELRFRRAGEAADAAATVVVSATGLYEAADGRDGAPAFQGTYGVARDISVRKRAEAALAHHAFHDPLTGLPNRTLFRDRLALALAQARRDGERAAVLFVDLDRFKLVNDTHGHVAGDLLLKHVAARLKGALREVDTVSRLGGDEFTAVVPGMRSVGDAERVARKVWHAVCEPCVLPGIELTVSCSIGVTVYPDHGADEEALLRHADLAMYQVKREGKHGVAVFEPAMAQFSGRCIALENDLRRALKRGELEVHFQPVVEETSGRVDSVEALVRWRHPEIGMLDPAQFIPLAEESGLIRELTAVVMAQAFGRLRQWRDAGLAGLRMAVNVSAREFLRARFVEEVMQKLAASGLPPDALELEITESMLIDDLDLAVTRVNRLRAAGVRVSIDDFGTRYSSLGYLHRLPVNTIKIDQSFVRGLTGARDSAPIVAAIVAIAAGFGFELVAEGVEDEGHVAALRALGCRKMQGYHFRRPQTAETLAPYLFSAPGVRPGQRLSP
jgi:diguanylate cyclase (GGDEF)-like protein/PAS domain S-box-containing protein